MTMKVGILGSGAFGRGLGAAAVHCGNDVILWSRSNKKASDGIQTTSDLAEVAKADLLFLAVPSRHVNSLIEDLGAHVDGRHLMVHVSRGLVGPKLRPITEVIREKTACRRVGAIAGPLLPTALIEHLPTGAVIGTHFPEVTTAVRNAIAGESVRIYESNDVKGVQIASAIVGLLAVNVGLARQLNLGPSAQAVLATRGMFEAARLGETFGAEQRTFLGLAGFGDLIAAVSDDGRPEVALGKALAQGKSVDAALRSTSGYIEGTELAHRLVDRAERFGIEMPLTAALLKLIEGKIQVEGALAELMSIQVDME